MKMFYTKCKECGENEIAVVGPDEVGFCSKQCEANYKYRQAHLDPVSGLKPTPEEVRSHEFIRGISTGKKEK